MSSRNNGHIRELQYIKGKTFPFSFITMFKAQMLGAVEIDENKNTGIPKNLSFENNSALNYHQTYYYPKLVWSRIRNRLEMDQKPGDEVVQRFLGSVAGLQDPPPSPEADLQEEDDTSTNVFEGHNLPADYSTYEGCSFEDREFDFLKAEPIKRSTSLKTNKTPPGTPSRKKVVRFADALGLDLESVRHILNLEAPPKIPATALKDLKVMPDSEEQKRFAVGSRYLTACFPQPGGASNFLQRVADQKVVLENCLVDDTDMLVTGSVRVANISYHKKVIVRYTVNNWLTFDDLNASYVANSNDGPTDRFSFTINIPQYFGVGSKMQFCLMYTAGGDTHWDSNYGNNYSVECYDRVVPFQEHHDQTWLHFL